MASKVKETPVLTGKDAKRFEKSIKANVGKRVSSKDYSRAVDTFKRVQSNSKKYLYASVVFWVVFLPRICPIVL